MAFYCLDCVNKLCNRTYDAKELVFSECLYIVATAYFAVLDC